MSIYQEALELANYEIEVGPALDTQFRNMFLDCVDGGMYSDLTCEEEVDDLFEEIGLEKIASQMVRKMRAYNRFHKK